MKYGSEIMKILSTRYSEMKPSPLCACVQRLNKDKAWTRVKLL